MRKYSKSIAIGIVLLVAATVFISCDAGRKDTGVKPAADIVKSSPDSSERLRIVATTSIVGDIVSQIVGDSADLKILMPRGQNPHSYEPTPRDIAAIERADLIFVNGLGLEEEFFSILEGFPDAPVVDLSEPVVAGSLILESGHEHDEHDHDAANPHLWFSVRNVMLWAETISSTLIRIDPSHQESYLENTRGYLKELNALDLEILGNVEKIPAGSRNLVMDHDSMAYFARDYGFKVAGLVIPTFSDQSEPSSREIASLVEMVRNEEIGAIFVGDTAGRALLKLTDSVASESGQEVHVVSLLSGSLAETGSRGDNYIDFMRYNTEQIVGALLP